MNDRCPKLRLIRQKFLALLDNIDSPATVATTGGRYLGFVIGGALPAALRSLGKSGCAG